jgi:hypothetical protein
LALCLVSTAPSSETSSPPPDLDKGLRIALKLNKAGWIMKDGVNKWVRTSNGIDAFYEQTQLMAKASMDKDNSLTRQADT